MTGKMSFEDSMVRLEQIVRAMERGDAKLDESLALFQEGTKLVRDCTLMLEQAQLQVQKVLSAADGSVKMEAFDHDAEA